MDLNEILAISGKPGLYKMVAQTKNSLVVESITDKKRIPAFATDKISALEDISVYTEDGDESLKNILKKIYEKEDGGQTISHKSNNKEIKDYFAEVVPNYDEDKVYVSDIKKILRWYNLLQENNMLDFEEDEEEKGKLDEKEEAGATKNDHPGKDENEPGSKDNEDDKK